VRTRRHCPPDLRPAASAALAAAAAAAAAAEAAAAAAEEEAETEEAATPCRLGRRPECSVAMRLLTVT